MDKSNWGDGPWMTEDDREEFEHAGLPCLLHRARQLGSWCGYAAVPPGHPMHGAGTLATVDVHGGVTYAAPCTGNICHVAKPGAPDDVWWFGFDCSHCDDLAPGLARYAGPTEPLGQYWTKAMVKAETMRLAEQLAAAAAP
jgi:hypothetical protein